MLPSTPLSTPASRSRKLVQLTAILFDLDGTLANTDPFHYQAWKELLQDFALEIDEAFYKSRISGRLNPAIVEDLLPQFSPKAAQHFIEQKEARFRELAPQLSPMPGLEDLIRWADVQSFKQAVVTNAPPDNVCHTLKALHLEQTFELVVIADELGIGKPDPAPYQYTLKKLGIKPEQAIAFEDSPSGIRSAVGAGIPTVGIASTQDPQTLYEVGAMLVVPDFSSPELWSLLGM